MGQMVEHADAFNKYLDSIKERNPLLQSTMSTTSMEIEQLQRSLILRILHRMAITTSMPQ